ncbi:hypothetical protein BSL82_18330 (plasmid) [Tardibacter chloracetimidivorans]|uniref:Uncharacterized protein n=1 Tax=Tardibacter chloracetimidivorans TaxID=1921510 RepID=A0A1L4A0P8_9SPHN|nr:hypothetical protein BSL82_18330 [Tardibacter chloracetimidivorans]
MTPRGRAPCLQQSPLDYFNGNVTNPFDELTWPSIAEGYLLVAQKAVSDALIALERANSVGWTKHGK